MGKIRIDSRNETKRAVRVLDIAIEIERQWTPVWIVERPIAPEVDPSRFRSIDEVSGPASTAIWQRLTTSNPPREDALTRARVVCSCVNLTYCFNLRLSQAGRRIAVFAQEGDRVKPALSRVTDDAICDAVQGIASRHHSVIQHGQFRNWERGFGSSV